jgi:hypothetical protein
MQRPKKSLTASRTHFPEQSNSNEEPKRLGVPPKTFAAILGVGMTTAWSLISSGRVESFRLGKRRLVYYPSIERLVNELREERAA